MIAELEEFVPKVSQIWSDTEHPFLSTSSLFRFSKKLKALKPVIRSPAKEKQGNLSKKAKEAYGILCEKQEENLENLTPQQIEEENKAYKRWKHVSWLEEGFLKQKIDITLAQCWGQKQ